MTIEEQYTELMENSCACRHLFDGDGNKKTGVLEAKTGAVYFKGDKDTRSYCIVTFSPDDVTSKIECNRLAKEFVKRYTIEQLQTDYIAAYERHYQNQLATEARKTADIEFFKSHLQDFQAVLPVGNFTTTEYNGGLKWEIRTERDHDYNYTLHFWFYVEIEKSDDLFKVSPCFFFGGNCANSEKRFNATYDELLTYLQESFNTRLMPEIDRVLKERAAIDTEKERKNKLWWFLDDISSGDKAVAIKLGKNSYICIHKTVEWSESPKTKGKFRRLNLNKIVEKILEKGLSEYATFNWDEPSNYNILNSIPFEKIPV